MALACMTSSPLPGQVPVHVIHQSITFFQQRLRFGSPFFLSLSDGVAMLDFINLQPSVLQIVIVVVVVVFPNCSLHDLKNKQNHNTHTYF